MKKHLTERAKAVIMEMRKMSEHAKKAGELSAKCTPEERHIIGGFMFAIYSPIDPNLSTAGIVSSRIGAIGLKGAMDELTSEEVGNDEGENVAIDLSDMIKHMRMPSDG